MDLNIYTEKCQASVADIFSFTNISLPDEFNDISYIYFFCLFQHALRGDFFKGHFAPNVN